jgi:hypothetical protein
MYANSISSIHLTIFFFHVGPIYYIFFNLGQVNLAFLNFFFVLAKKIELTCEVQDDLKGSIGTFLLCALNHLLQSCYSSPPLLNIRLDNLSIELVTKTSPIYSLQY